MEDMNNQYLGIKKSYEVLSDPEAKKQYDIKQGHVQSNNQTSEFVRKMNSFHYSQQSSRGGDVPHFDKQKHYERNERMEHRYRMKMTDMGTDVFGQNIYHRRMKNSGPKKGIYNDYSHNHQSNKGILRFILAASIMSLGFYLIKGMIQTNRIQERRRELEKIKQDKPVPKKKPLSINNDYGKHLLNTQSQKEKVSEKKRQVDKQEDPDKTQLRPSETPNENNITSEATSPTAPAS